MSELLQVGQTAPDFTLPSSAASGAGASGDSISLRDFRGQNVILAFYPADWSAVCGDELAVFNQILPLFHKLDAALIGISVDSAFCHQAFRDDRGFKMSLLADFEPKGAVARQYGVYRDKDGFSERALFVIDAQGVIRYSFVSPMDVNPGASELLKTLKQIQGKGNPMSESQLTLDVSTSDHSQGSPSAPVTLVEYGDYECSYCGDAHKLVKAAQQQMGDGLRFVFRNFPLADVHPHAAHAAEAAEDANAQGQFWKMHDMLYENQSSLEDSDLTSYAARLGLDEKKFAADMKAGKSQPKIQADFESGAESGVNGTPSFFINGVRFDGDWQGDGLLRALQNA